jgi:hypothetical protein
MCTRLTRGSLSAGPFVMAAVIAGLTIGLAAAERRGQAKPAPAARATLTFTEFHGAAAVADYLRQVAGQYPAVTELIEIGRTAGNRPIQVLVVSNMKAGVAIDSLVALQNPRTPPVNNVTPMKAYMGKPGLWLDGGTHGRSLAGTEVCLYAIQKLVSGYGIDAEVTKLVDEDVFYICPLVHDDAPAKAGAPVAETPTPANGNYPEGWWTDDGKPGGTGAYPASSPEARSVLEFFTNHTNILFAQTFHTNGGAALRPFARWPDSRIDARDAAVFDKMLGKKYLDLTGLQADAWRGAFNQERRAPGGFGAFADWAYGQFGAYALSIQAWDAQRQAKPVPGEGLASLCETHWQFEKYQASLLPHVTITEASAKVLYTTNQAVRASSVQEGGAVVVKKGGATPGRYKVVQITATVANGGALPTHVAQGAQLRGNREDVIWLLGDRTKITLLDGSRWMRLGVLDGTTALPPSAAPPGGAGARGGGGGRGAGPASTAALAEMRVQRPEAGAGRQTGSKRTVTWLVAIDGDAPVKLAVTSQKGGTAVRDLAIQ